jgi:FkbH-like protein
MTNPSPEQRRRCVLLSDFNAATLAGYLGNDAGAPRLDTHVVPFGQLLPAMLGADHEAWRERADVVVVWTRPEGVLESFGALLEQRPVPADILLEEVDRFADLVVGLRARAPVVLVAQWVLAPWLRGLGLADYKAGGVQAALLEVQARLAARLRDVDGVYLLHTARWTEAAGKEAFNPKFWYMGKIAFGTPVMKAASEDIRACLRGLMGQSRKLIVLDLDDTLWGGIVGDEGWENLRLGGHDALGEAFVDFQRALKALQGRGIQLAVVSKNTEATALEAIEKHPEMRLRKDDFIAWRINWSDKARNIAELVEEVNLGLQSVVFIDDNPAERARVREQLPEVLVPEWPADKMLYRQALAALDCFDTPAVTKEDLERTRSYVAERKRKESLSSVGSLDAWLRSLELEVEVEPLGPGSVKRIAQLLNKTNQMNLTTRRMTEAELVEWGSAPGRKVLGLRVKDRFGDSGLTGLVGVDAGGEEAALVDFVLSCRVFGRELERLMVHLAVEHARAHGRPRLAARFVRTAKNGPTLEFLQRSGLADEGDARFTWDASVPYACPDFIRVMHPEGG